MVDVLHFWFEEDMTAVTAEHAQARSGIRIALYRELYGTRYKYALKEPNNQASMSTPDFSTPTPANGDKVEYLTEEESKNIDPFNPTRKNVERVQAPTPMNAGKSRPFGNLIDPPMSH